MCEVAAWTVVIVLGIAFGIGAGSILGWAFYLIDRAVRAVWRAVTR